MASAREEQVDAILLSNPRNPCGTSIREERLAELVRFAKDTGILLLLDEHYSQYAYSGNALADDGSLSAAAFLDDPDDPVVMFDGLTKSFRYPGWRLGWTVGPESIIDRITAAGSSLDGGPNRLVQRAAIEVLKPGRAEQETRATRAQFRKKRDVCVSRLEEMGITFDPSPDSTIYAFGSTRNLPGPLSSGEGFFLAALRHCVVTVPGAYFDLSLSVTPDTPSPGIADCVRFSFGPPLEILVRGLNRIELMLHDHIDRPFGGMRSRAPSMIVSAQNR